MLPIMAVTCFPPFHTRFNLPPLLLFSLSLNTDWEKPNSAAVQRANAAKMITCSLQSLRHLNISTLFPSANATVVASPPSARVTDVSGRSTPACAALREILGCAEITGFAWGHMLTSILRHRLLFAQLPPSHRLFRLGKSHLRIHSRNLRRL